jgi:hypothetical protein
MLGGSWRLSWVCSSLVVSDVGHARPMSMSAGCTLRRACSRSPSLAAPVLAAAPPSMPVVAKECRSVLRPSHAARLLLLDLVTLARRDQAKVHLLALAVPALLCEEDLL